MPSSNRKRGFRNRVYGNLKLYLDDIFITRGLYDNVSSGEYNIYGNDISVLLPVQNDPFYPTNSGSTTFIWQAYHKNWISESGLDLFASGLTTPTVASGIYVDNVFYPVRDFDGVSGIGIDFRNGRAIIESGLPFSSVVRANYSHKEVWVDTISRDMITNQVSIIDNVNRVAINNVPSGEIGQLPMVLMQVGSEESPRGLQLGGGIIRYPLVNLHVIANNRYDKDEIVDILQLRHNNTIVFVDLDAASGQFTYYGGLGTGNLSYSGLKATYPDRLVFIEDVSLVNNDDIADEGYYTALLRMRLRIDISEEV